MRRALGLVLVTACALTSRSEPREVRYFAPELAPAAVFTGTPCARVRLGRVVASAALRTQIQRRISPVEVVPYEALQWTDPPEVYVRRALAAALSARPIAPALSGAVLVLDVEVLAFEEVVVGAAHGGRVVLRYELRDERQVVAQGETPVEHAAAGPQIDAVVAAIGSALTASSAALADRVVAAACPRR